jgi:Protein of unknown function (DUF2769)
MAKVPDTRGNEDRCICSECPSDPREGRLYCARGKTQNPVRRRGCICDECANFREYDLADGYYCADGRAGEGPE